MSAILSWISHWNTVACGPQQLDERERCHERNGKKKDKHGQWLGNQCQTFISKVNNVNISANHCGSVGPSGLEREFGLPVPGGFPEPSVEV